MEKFYSVTQLYFDDGSVECIIDEVFADKKPADKKESRSSYDRYVDFFDTLDAAAEFESETYAATEG